MLFSRQSQIPVTSVPVFKLPEQLDQPHSPVQSSSLIWEKVAPNIKLKSFTDVKEYTSWRSVPRDESLKALLVPSALVRFPAPTVPHTCVTLTSRPMLCFSLSLWICILVLYSSMLLPAVSLFGQPLLPSFCPQSLRVLCLWWGPHEHQDSFEVWNLSDTRQGQLCEWQVLLFASASAPLPSWVAVKREIIHG